MYYVLMDDYVCMCMYYVNMILEQQMDTVCMYVLYYNVCTVLCMNVLMFVLCKYDY